MKPVYYNEFDPFTAEWLRELIKAGVIAPGEVDERSIVDVESKDLKGFTQCHFFAGIGTWSYALRCAGWDDSRPVWTGSPPCQPFSAAGKRKGKEDDRHLAPHWLDLVSESRPPVVFGEQVEAAIRHGWFDDLQAHLEAEDYACGMVVLPACGVGAPQIRQRQWIVAERMGDASEPGLSQQRGLGRTSSETIATEPRQAAERTGTPTNGLADTGDNGRDQGRERQSEAGDDGIVRNSATERLADTECHGYNRANAGATKQSSDQQRQRLFDRDHIETEGQPATGPTNGFWRAADWLFCRDGKWRPVEPGTFPLVNGTPARVGRLRGYGNGIVAEEAQAFIESYLETGESATECQSINQ